VIRIRDLKKHINDRSQKAKDPGITVAGGNLIKRLMAVEEEIYQVRNQSNQDPLNFPIKLNNRIAALRRTVETGDTRPTNGSYGVFKELTDELDVQLVKLKTLESSDLVVLNKLLAAKNLEAVK
jgi:hypothetical protein